MLSENPASSAALCSLAFLTTSWSYVPPLHLFEPGLINTKRGSSIGHPFNRPANGLSQRRAILNYFYYRRYVTNVSAAVLRVRNVPEVAVATAPAPTTVWPEAAAVTVKAFAPVAIADQSNDSPTSISSAASITAPVSREATTAAAVVEVTIPEAIIAAVSVPVALSTPGVPWPRRARRSRITAAVPLAYSTSAGPASMRTSVAEVNAADTYSASA